MEAARVKEEEEIPTRDDDFDDVDYEEEEEEEEEEDNLDNESMVVMVDNQQPLLEKLPRPVNELNCRMSRAYLVKLLRAANGGQNPAYGNPDKKPPFWPDYYWPWEKLTDVHTKPKGMQEPLQYSEMMKLAINRGYNWFGYDPNEYVDPTVDLSEKQNPDVAPPPPAAAAAVAVSTVVSEAQRTKSLNKTTASRSSKAPPRLPRPASKLNCVQARCSLSKLLRYQQMGNNPVYGSPDTRPPWWPEECIRWCDMVDLRGKPPYLPDQRSYVDVLRLAVIRACEYYGHDPETYVSATPTARPITITPNTQRPCSLPSSPPPPPPLTDDADYDSSLPPRLAMPIKKMNCSTIRIALSKLLWFNNKNLPPQYGSALSMPVWWPNHLMDWTRMKNLRHKYDGPLGNTYTNCLRMALIRGYAFHGIDPNEHLEQEQVSVATDGLHSENMVIEPAIYEEEGDAAAAEDTLWMDEDDIAENVPSNGSEILFLSHEPPPLMKTMRKPMPPLLPLTHSRHFKSAFEEICRKRLYEQSLLDTRDWFPPKLINTSGWAPIEVMSSLRKCKVVMDRSVAERFHGAFAADQVRVPNPALVPLTELFRRDRRERKFTDAVFVADDKISFWVHKLVVAAHSPKMERLLRDGGDETCSVVHFAGIESGELELLIDALYCGEVRLVGEKQRKRFASSLKLFQEFGMLTHLLYRTANSNLANAEDTVCDYVEIAAEEGEDGSNTAICQLSEESVDQASNVKQVRAKRKFLETENNKDEGSSVKVKCVEQSPAKNKGKKRSMEASDTEGGKSTRKTTEVAAAAAVEIMSYKAPPNLDEVDKSKLVRFSKKDNLAFAKWLMDLGLLIPPPPCHCCSSDCVLVDDFDAADEVSWCCSKGSQDREHDRGVNVRHHSLFEKSPESLKWIMKIVICWKDNTSLNQCQQETGAEVDKIFAVYDACTEFFKR